MRALTALRPSQGGPNGSLYARLQASLQPPALQLPDTLRVPRHAHRLDEATGGLLLVAKTRPALQALSMAFELKRTRKRYAAIVKGELLGSGSIDAPVDGKPALTTYRAVGVTPSASFGALTTVHLWPETGRRHQLRKHMALHGHPILGDRRYRAAGGPRVAAGSGAGGGGSQSQDEGHVSDAGSSEDHNSEEAERVCAASDAGAQQEVGSAALDAVRRRSAGEGTWEDSAARQQKAAAGSGSSDHLPASSAAKAEQHAARAQVAPRNQRNMDVLADGREAPLCLWAVELHFEHPVSKQAMTLSIPEPAMYEAIRRTERVDPSNSSGATVGIVT